MEDKIIFSVEILAGVFRHLQWDLGREYKLPPLQTQILLHISAHSLSNSNITQISNEFSISKPTVSRSLSALVKKKLAVRKTSLEDKRRSVLCLTPEGKRIVKKLSGWNVVVKRQLKKCSDEATVEAVNLLMELIAGLQDQGIISISRVCMTCGNFLKDMYPGSETPHYCKLIERRVAPKDLQVGCDSYLPRLKAKKRSGLNTNIHAV